MNSTYADVLGYIVLTALSIGIFGFCVLAVGVATVAFIRWCRK